MPEAPETAVIVAVPAAEIVVGEHRARLDQSAAWGVPAHVTVLYPFVPPAAIDDSVLTELARALSGVPEFRAGWHTTGWFGDEVLWLAPEPQSSFRALTTAVTRAFPNYPPYHGQFDDVVPHLTIGDAAPPKVLREAEQAVLARLPIAMDVRTVQLMRGTTTPDSWRTIAEFPLGNPA